MSDVPLGEGWWIASDGRWYPPDAHVDTETRWSPSDGAATPPGPGWWKASDGHWYAPELHPDYLGRQAGSGARGHSAVTGSYHDAGRNGYGPGQSGNGGHVNGNGYVNGNGHANGRPFGSGNGLPKPNASGNGHVVAARAGDGSPVNGNARTVRGGPLPDYRPTPTDLPLGGGNPRPGVAGSGTAVIVSAGMTARQIAPASPGLSLAASGGGRPPDDLPFDPMQDPATLLGDWNAQAPAAPPAPAPPARPPAQAPTRPPVAPPVGGGGERGRPSRPGFDRPIAPPPGSTVRQQLPQTPYRSKSQGQKPRGDGFDEWLETFGAEPAGRPQRVVQPVQRLTHTDATTGGRATIGGPQTAPPRLSNREADFFVLKPVTKKTKPARQNVRRRLSTALFLTILFLVLAAGTIAVLVIHSHPH